MCSLLWFALLSCLLLLNTSVLGVLTPKNNSLSFLSPRFHPRSVHLHTSFPGSSSQLYGGHSRSPSGVSTATDTKREEAAHSFDSIFFQLKKWLISNGADLDIEGLTLKTPSESEYEAICGETEKRYLTARRHYSRDAIIASIPSRLHFTSDVLEELLNYCTEDRNTRGSQDPSSAAEISVQPTQEISDLFGGELTLFSSNQVNIDARIRLSLVLAAFQDLLEDASSSSLLSRFKVLTYNSNNTPHHLSLLLQGWLVYLQLLSPLPPSNPLLWNVEELRALNHPVSHTVFARLQCLYTAFLSSSNVLRCRRHRWAVDTPQLNNKQLFQKLIEAHATVNSRSIRLNQKTHAFIPLIDLCAHATHSPNAKLQLKGGSSSSSNSSSSKSSSSNSSSSSNDSCKQAGVDSERKQEEAEIISNKQQTEQLVEEAACSNPSEVSVHLVALRDIAPGESIKIAFGDKLENATLLLNYGLLPKDNPHEKLALEFSPSRVYTALRAVGAEILMLTEDFNYLGKKAVKELTDLHLLPSRCTDSNSSSCGVYTSTVFVNNREGPDQRLRQAAKVVTENEDLFAGSEEAPKDAEERASRFLISFLQQALFEQFSTTEEEDSNILRSKQIVSPSLNRLGLEQIQTLTPQMEVAVRFRQKRRNILIKAIKNIQDSLKRRKT